MKIYFDLSAMAEIYPAHIRESADEDNICEIQTVAEHCRNVACYAKDSLAPFGLGQTGFLVGLLHDMGKYTKRFREYIVAAAKGEKTKRGAVKHSFVGVKFLLLRYHSANDGSFRELAAEIIAFAVGSHHGLFDCLDENGKNGFDSRLNEDEICYKDAVGNFLKNCADEQEIDKIFRQAEAEITVIFKKLVKSLPMTGEEGLFYNSLFARLILSALIDADWRDTEEFSTGIKNGRLSEEELSRKWLEAQNNFREHLKKLEEKSADSEIAKARRRISELCEISLPQGGVYRLNLPTGAGKTLSSLRFALNHAKESGTKTASRHIFFIMPLLSIIDQNAAEIKKAVGLGSLVCEHHSNVVQPSDADNEEAVDDTVFRRILAQNWREPVIITTLVQFLITSFSQKKSALRRFSALAGSIIVIDEVQSVPNRLLSCFNLLLNFLAVIGKSTIVLCSATQPPFDCGSISHRMYGIKTLLELPSDMEAVFRRTTLKPEAARPRAGIAERAKELIEEVPSVLIIANTKAEAKEIFAALRDEDTGIKYYHLSAGMCMAHRQKVIHALTASLKEKKARVVCVATQVIEAGIDISFAAVIRIAAGLDNIVQASGRCNRHNENPQGAHTLIIKTIDTSLEKLKEIKAARDAFEHLLAEYSKNPAKYESRLDSKAAVDYYYNVLYDNQKLGYQDYHIETDKIKTSLFKLLSDNKDLLREGEKTDGYMMHQAMLTAGKNFKVFDDDTVDVIAAYGEGENLIALLQSEKARQDIAYAKKLVREAKLYTVSVYPYKFDEFMKNGAIDEIAELGIFTLKREFYDDTVGIV